MTTVAERPVAVPPAPAPAPAPAPTLARKPSPKPLRARDRFIDWVWDRRLSLVILGGLLVAVGAANAWNLQGWPGRVNDDEATYVAQAWAMVARGDIAHYTYWYDHPFLGWAMIAGYAWLTDGFNRLPSGVMVGREFMLLTTIATAALLFLLARRLGLHRVTASAVVLLFGLSPLAIHFHRMVFLDNIATMWIVGALAVAASRRRSLAAAFWSAVCMAAAVLTKETIAILLPAVVWLLLQHTDRRTRSWNLGVFGTTFITIVAAYPMYALLKNELLPGDGHVSLTRAVWWQLFGRSGSGSLLDPSSGTYSLTMSWLDMDAWLLLGGVLLIPAGLAVRRLRPIAVALLIQVLMMMRGGYLPYAYVIALLPFAALLLGGVVELGWRYAAASGRTLGRQRVLWLPVVAAITAFAVFAIPAWSADLGRQSTVAGDANSRAATRWIVDHAPRDAVVVTDDYIWLDLTLHDFDNAVWLWKVDNDPQVMREHLPDGYRSIDYLVMANQAQSTLDSLPTLKEGFAHSSLVATFGEVEVRRVDL